MAVTVKRAEPVKAPPIKEIVVEGNASSRGFVVNSPTAGRLTLRGTCRGRRVPDYEKGWTVALTKKEATQFIADLTELVSS